MEDELLPDDAGLLTNLSTRAMAGGAVTLSAEAVKLLTRTGLLMTVSRLVAPEDFGVYSMVTAITGVIGLFKDLGLPTATIQRRTISHQQVSMLFWVNISGGLVMAAATAAMAPFIGWFYHDPRLVKVALVIAAMFILNGASSQPAALLGRQMRFFTIEAISVTSLLCSGTVMIWAALRGAGYWTYVLERAVNTFLSTVLIWTFTNWRPSLPKRGSKVRDLLLYGRNLSGINLLTYVHRSFDNMLIGRYWGSMALGLYSRAYGLLTLPLIQIMGPIGSVIVPALSRLQDHPDRFKTYAMNAAKGVAFLSMPLVAFTFVDTREIILFIAGKQWLGSVPIFKALAPAAFTTTIFPISNWVLLSLGQTHRMFKMYMALCAASCLGYVFGLPWGSVGVAWAFSIVYGAALSPILIYSLRLSPVSVRDIAAALWQPILTSFAAGTGLRLMKPLLPEHSMAFIALISDSILYLAAYAACWTLLPGGFSSILNMLYSFKKVFRPEAAR